MTSTPMKLVYFDFRGKGELLRYILTVAGVDFVEERYEFEQEWPKLKEACPSPTKQLPYMEIEGKPYAQSIALARFLARKYGMSGETELEALHADMLVCMVEDVRQMIYDSMVNPTITQEQKDAIRETVKEKKGPLFFGTLEKTLSENPSGFLVGNKLTFADLSVADLDDQVEKQFPGFHDNYPKVKAHWEMIRALPRLAEYLAKRKDTFI